ncbi:MAG TPA: tetratricopeptide repeat protein [Bacteroidia bacterium]|jgi:tetratricopeptide (TPR) repeat protein
MKHLLFIISIALSSTIAFSQSNPLDKKMEKARELIKKDKIADAETYLEKVLIENPEFGDGWDLLAKIRYKQYKDAKVTDNLFNNVVITTKDKDGKEIKDDSLANSVRELMTSIKPSKKAFNKYLYTMKDATLTSNDAVHCSIILRNYYVDKEIDTALTKKAVKYFNDGEEEFTKKNYEKAAKSYKRAIEEQPDFYKASLYLGDCYYFIGNYVEAIKYFKESSAKFPEQLEPRKYLVDAYAKESLYPNCLDEAIGTMTVYPDLSMLEKLEDAAYLNNKKLDIKWTPRGCFPNKAVKDTTKNDLNQYTNDKRPATKEPWTHYEKALDKIKTECNADGILKGTSALTKSKYMEVYCWEEMLKNSSDPSLEEAKRMQKDGFLDCYVLVTCFHIDFYAQYKDFVTKNKDKVNEYFHHYLTAK